MRFLLPTHVATVRRPYCVSRYCKYRFISSHRGLALRREEVNDDFGPTSSEAFNAILVEICALRDGVAQVHTKPNSYSQITDARLG